MGANENSVLFLCLIDYCRNNRILALFNPNEATTKLRQTLRLPFLTVMPIALFVCARKNLAFEQTVIVHH